MSVSFYMDSAGKYYHGGFWYSGSWFISMESREIKVGITDSNNNIIRSEKTKIQAGYDPSNIVVIFTGRTSADEFKIYSNGEKLLTDNIIINSQYSQTDVNSELYWGHTHPNIFSTDYNAFADDFRIYDTQLVQSQIDEIWNMRSF